MNRILVAAAVAATAAISFAAPTLAEPAANSHATTTKAEQAPAANKHATMANKANHTAKKAHATGKHAPGKTDAAPAAGAPAD